LARAFGKRDVQVEQASLKLESVSDQDGTRVGEFAVEIVLVEQAQGVTTETALAGTIVLQTDTCWPVTTELGGTVRLRQGSKEVGSGKVTMQVQASYE
jgi:hypothetical protein